MYLVVPGNSQQGESERKKCSPGLPFSISTGIPGNVPSVLYNKAISPFPLIDSHRNLQVLPSFPSRVNLHSLFPRPDFCFYPNRTRGLESLLTKPSHSHVPRQNHVHHNPIDTEVRCSSGYPDVSLMHTPCCDFGFITLSLQLLT